MLNQHTKNGNHILIVDDEEAVSKMFASTLDRYDCVTAGDAQEALRLLSEREFALVISDVQMPGLSGVELLRKIIDDFPDVMVIMVSGIDRPQRVIDMLRIGAFDYLLKPCDLDVLELTVERALAHGTLLRNGKRYKTDLERRNQELARQKAKLERLQAQLVQSEKMASIGLLAGGVAHELNNPAGFIYSNMESLVHYTHNLSRLLSAYDNRASSEQIDLIKSEIRYEEGLLPELQSIVEDCQEGARRIRDIVLNLRTFSRLDEAQLKQINIHEGIDATIRLLSQYYGSGRIKLTRLYGELPRVECFAGQLNQVWMNLLTNAAQSIGDQGGEVRIETTLEDESVMVRISDTGGGIAAEHLEKIFDPFFTTKPVGEGTGLGLSISYGIVVGQGGSITVESTVGKGTTFTTLIPLRVASRPGDPTAKRDHKEVCFNEA